MPRTKIPLSLKVEIVKSARAGGNVKRTARKYNVQPCQIRRWRNNIEEITQLADQNLKRLNVHKGRKIIEPDLEDAVYTWVIA